MWYEGIWNRLMICNLTGRIISFGRRLSAFSSSGRRLLTVAALFHLTLAAGLFCAGRAGVAPGLVDRDGIMASFAFDSYQYQQGAVHLLEVFKHDGIRAWAAEPAPIHVKLLSLQFAILGPLFGDSVLSAEPLNLLCYLTILILVFMLGREAAGRRVGLISAAILAIWPTFLLHTIQLLKDPLFIAGTIALVLYVTTWLTRVYNRRVAVIAGGLTTVTILILLLIRFSFGLLVLVLVLLGLALLIVRQAQERRLLFWNMACPILALMTIGLLTPFYKEPQIQRFKQYPSTQDGQPKSVSQPDLQLATTISYPTGTLLNKGTRQTHQGWFCARAVRTARRISSIRSRFAASYPEAGSILDGEVEFRDFSNLILYLPRAFEIGFWSPFPNTWLAMGKRVGNAGKVLSSAETLIIYLFELLAFLAVLRSPHHLTSWLLLLITIFGLTALGLVIPNVGALYRFRYTFWVLLIILGVKGLNGIITRSAGKLCALGPVEAN